MEKPHLERRTREGQYGEIVEELTPESERQWAEYLRLQHLAKIAMFKLEYDKLEKEQ